MFSFVDIDYENIANQITKRTAEKLEKEIGLVCIGTGGGMMGDIYHKAMSFHYYQEVDLKKARELLVYASQCYLSAINTDKKVRPYLHVYPFPIQNIEIDIWSKEPDGKNVPFDKIACFGVLNGVVKYLLDRPNKTYITFYKETYEEAVRIVEGERAYKNKEEIR